MRLNQYPQKLGEFFQLAGNFVPAIKVGETRSELVHRDSSTGFSLYLYSLEDAKSINKTILIIPHIINRPYILDLAPDLSVIRGFCQNGFKVYLIDWGYPSLEQQHISFFEYNQYVDFVVRHILKEKASVLGYCTGGIISLILASLYPESIRNLILLATPVDFSCWNDPRISGVRIIDARKLASVFGNIPGQVANAFGYCMLTLYLPFFSWNLEFYAENFAFESWRDSWRKLRWIMDAPDIPASAYIDFIEGFYQNNLLIQNKFRVGSGSVDLGSIKCSVLNILAKYDHLIPLDSGLALKEVYSGEDYQTIVFPSSHTGLTISRKAHEKLWPKVRDWILTRSGL